MASYAALTDVRTYGITPVVASDALVTDRLDVASRIIDGYTGTFFTLQTQLTVTVNDVRIPLLALPAPFTNITSVTVNGQVAASTAYAVEPWGLRLYRAGFYDADGFPQNEYNDLGYVAPARSRWGSQVAVTADFGYATVPTPVRHATVLITAMLIANQNETFVDPRILKLQVEGYMVMYGKSADELLESTGVIEADRLLRPFRTDLVQVG